MAGIGRPADLDKLLLSKTLIYISLVILQVCSIVSISTAKINLSGKCVLFAECSNESNKTEVDIEEDPRHCDFVLYTCVVELIFLTILTPYHLFIFYKSRWDADAV
ncbi:hypothetical protein EB796_011963 [Bugula neritina]|uniref:Uncharacterized protein n=1 Tax=Bugula neritina TaxID=10212 RepID=A0A7J7JTN1_BUGNE|nr:hypothetical protein EB796_011963 [Bugula neritina]